MPAMEACRPPSTVVNHSSRPTTTYGLERHTCRRLICHTATRHRAATSNGIGRRRSL